MKEKERLHEIRSYLIQREKATWTEISNATRIQPKELSYDLRKLLDKREITTEQDAKDRRKTWYTLSSKKKTEAETKRYETTEFILGLKNPLYREVPLEETLRKLRLHAKLGFFFEPKNVDAKALQIAMGGINVSQLLIDLGGLVKTSDKGALTITFERIEKSKGEYA
jgi:DNA-binding MarR family transcriptional regulator